MRHEVRGECSRVAASPDDRFEQLIHILCEVRADCEIKKKVLDEIGALVGAKPDSNLSGKVAECIANPDEFRKMEEMNRKLQAELDASKSDLFILKENAAATADMVAEARRLTEQVRIVFGEHGSTAVRAKLFDEGVQKEGKISGSRVIRILTDFAEQVEKTLELARTVAERMDDSSKRLTELPIRMSNLSFPSIDLGNLRELGNKTPQSKKSLRESAVHMANIPPINLDSPMQDAEPVGAEGERNRNLSEVFEELEEKHPEPSLEDSADVQIIG